MNDILPISLPLAFLITFVVGEILILALVLSWQQIGFLKRDVKELRNEIKQLKLMK